MARLPLLWNDPNGAADQNNWGSILNAFLQVAHNADGTIIPTAVNLTLNGVTYGRGAAGLAATAQGGANTFLVANAGAPNFSSNPNLLSTGSTTARGLATRASEIVNVKDFGVLGDGVTDDRAAINTAISSGANRVLYFPDGTYVLGTTSGVLDDFGFDSALNIQVDNLRIVLSDNAIIKYTGPTLVGGLGVNLLFIRGTKTSETTHTGSAIRATSFVVASATNFAIGDDIAITNGTDANPTDFEINRISNIVGTTITVAHPLENAYPSGTRVLSISWRRNISVYGGQWNANNRGRTIIHAQFAQNTTVESIRGKNTLADGRGIASTLYSTNNKWIRNYLEDISDRGIEEYTTTWNELIEGNTVLRAAVHGIAVHGRHVRVIANLVIGCATAASGNAGIHLDTAHHVKIIGNHANQGLAHGFQTASDTVDAVFIGNEATSNVGRGFDFATGTDCTSIENIAYTNGDDSYRFGAGITRWNSTTDKSFTSAGWGFNVLAGAANTNLFGYLSQADTSGAFQDAGTNTKSSQFDASGFTITGGGNTVFKAPTATSSTLQMAIGASNYAFYGVAGSAGAIVPGSVLGDTFLRTEAGKMLFSTNGGSTVGMTLGASGGGLQLGAPTGGDPGSGKVNISGAQGYQINGTTINTLTLKTGTGAGDYTTASATYVDVDTTNLALSVTIPTGFKLLINAACAVKHSTLAATIGLSLIDGSTIIEEIIEAAVAGDREHMGLTWAITGDGASHTVKLQWKTSAATATMSNGSSTLKPQMTFLMVPSA